MDMDISSLGFHEIPSTKKGDTRSPFGTFKRMEGKATTTVDIANNEAKRPATCIMASPSRGTCSQGLVAPVRKQSSGHLGPKWQPRLYTYIYI